MRASSPDIRSANTPRLPPPAPLRSADAARLLKMRGRAMQGAVPVGEGAMGALIGIEIDGAEAAAAEASAEGGVCVVANDNAPGRS